MVTPRHDIWLADLARAIAALQPGDDRAVEIMAGLLGIATESARAHVGACAQEGRRDHAGAATGGQSAGHGGTGR